MKVNDLEAIEMKKVEVDENIHCHQQNISLLLDFSIGYKNLSWTRSRLRHYQKCDLRMISTIKNLHMKIRELEKESDLLNKILKKSKNIQNNKEKV